MKYLPSTNNPQNPSLPRQRSNFLPGPFKIFEKNSYISKAVVASRILIGFSLYNFRLGNLASFSDNCTGFKRQKLFVPDISANNINTTDKNADETTNDFAGIKTMFTITLPYPVSAALLPIALTELFFCSFPLSILRGYVCWRAMPDNCTPLEI